jgi:hypothetical protein
MKNLAEARGKSQMGLRQAVEVSHWGLDRAVKGGKQSPDKPKYIPLPWRRHQNGPPKPFPWHYKPPSRP